LREIDVYSHEELARRLQWCRDRRDPAIHQISRWTEIDRSDLTKILLKKEKPSVSTARILTDFFQKWDAGHYVMDGYKLAKSKEPKPRVNLTVDWKNPKIMFKNNAEVVGVSWLGDAINKLEMLGSSESISVSHTDPLKATKKSARKGVRP
jgi:hypothetical protein